MVFHSKDLIFAALLPVSINLVCAEMMIPAGFEELAVGQRLWLDVSLYGDSLGLFEVDVNLENVTFIQPEKLLEAVRTHFNDAPALQDILRTVLAGPLPRNGHLACSSNGDSKGCDYLATDSAAIIYDENNARINLFLDKRAMPKPEVDRIWYQASRETDNALIHQQNLNFVAERDYQSFSIQGNGALAVTQSGYFNLDWNWSGLRTRKDHDREFRVNNAWFRQDLWRQYYIQAGEMDPRDLFSNAGGNITLSQLPIGKIRGVRVGSTRAWLNTSQVSQGTPIAIFLSRSARIDARRGNQLLASFYLNAGAQTLDTRSFPDGSYIVSLAIFENNRLVRTEEVPFTRTGLALFDRVEWFLQGGKTANDTADDERSSIVLAGVRLPVNATLALTSGVTITKGHRFVENAIDWNHGFNSGVIDGVLSTRFSYFYGSQGERGNIQQVSYNDGFSLSFFRNALSAENCNSGNAGIYGTSGCYRTMSMMFSVPVGSWYASLGYSDNRSEGRYVQQYGQPVDNEHRNSGLFWEPVYFTRSRTKSWQVGLSKSFSISGLNINSSLNVFMQDNQDHAGRDQGGFLSFSLSRSSHNSGSRSRYTSLGASWQYQQHQKNQLGYNVAHNWYTDDRGENEYGLSAAGINSDTLNALAYLRRSGQYGNGSLTLNNSWDREMGHNTLSSSGNYSSTLALARSGLWFGRWGDGGPTSGIAVRNTMPEENQDAHIAVSLDSGGYAEIGANKRALFAVTGYQQTTLSVNESLDVTQGASSEITRGAGNRSVFMVPGKILYHDVQSISNYTWFGQLTDEKQSPLIGMPLNVTDWNDLGQGGFSARSNQLLSNLYLLRQSQFYQCALAVKSQRDVIRYVGTVQCREMTFSALPVQIQHQAKTMQQLLTGRSPEVDSTAMKSSY